MSLTEGYMPYTYLQAVLGDLYEHHALHKGEFSSETNLTLMKMGKLAQSLENF